MVTKELVLKLGCEGGGAAVYLTALASGGLQFHAEGNSMFLDENDEEGWREWTNEPVGSIEAALQSIMADGSWIYLHPITVHPEYRNAVWQHVQETQRARTNDPAEMWHRSRQQWLAACSAE